MVKLVVVIKDLWLVYADNITDNYMPLGIHMSKKIVDAVIGIGGLGTRC
jgi:S-adenosylmethionine synthetase